MQDMENSTLSEYYTKNMVYGRICLFNVVLNYLSNYKMPWKSMFCFLSHNTDTNNTTLILRTIL